jgi:hypothetical protein
MKARRFQFTVVRVDDGITITMNCGNGMYRSRNVPADFLRKLIAACRHAQSLIVALRRKKSEALAALPAYPNCQAIAETDLGPCSLRITASRGKPSAEFQVSFYDADEQKAPALLLIDEQIEEFITQADAALTVSDAESPEA